MGDAHFETIPSSPSKESKSIFKSEDIKFCEDILPTRKQELVRSKQLLNGIGSLIQEHEGIPSTSSSMFYFFSSMIIFVIKLLRIVKVL